MAKIKFLPSGISVEVSKGTTVLQAEQLAGIRQDAPCGGHGTCGKCKVIIEGKEVPACQTVVKNDMEVTVLSELKDAEILTEGIRNQFVVNPVQEGGCHIAVDIGTTTVVAYLLDGKTGEILGNQSMLNPQFSYGADVISRIQAALKGKQEEQTSLIREGVWSLIRSLCETHKIPTADIGTVAIVANPAMQQLFFGVSPENLSKPPFAPHFTKTEVLQMNQYFPVSGNGKLLVVPDIAGYVGADTVGCILSTGMYQDSRMTLMIDIGTNGEMVLGNCEKMAACSTAAGPALEGGRISSGMRGSKGAIDHVWWEKEKLCFSVIGNEKPQGICGSGMIDAVAVMLEQEILNKRGRIQKDFRCEGKERIYDLAEGVSLNQKDIREIQMAKGAIAAGIDLLMKHLQITMEEIDRVILCGAFGTYMNSDSACLIGLLPQELRERIETGGNAAGMGSVMMALDKEKFALTNEILNRTEGIELASFPEFQRIYASNMMFPEKEQ